MFLNVFINAVIFICKSKLLILFFLFLSCSQKDQGNIIIKSNPSGAKAFINGDFIGYTPIILEKTNQYSKAKLNLVLEGFHEYQTSLDKSKYHHIDLLPYERNLIINFTPTPDKVFINDVQVVSSKKSLSDIVVTLPLGKHEIFAYKENYPFFEHSIHLSRDSSEKVHLFLPTTKNQNVLSLTGIPDQIGVYYKDKYLGYTPMALKNFSLKPFTLEFIKLGFERKVVLFNITKKESSSAIVRLAPIKRYVQLIFTNLVQDSKITINKKLVVGRSEKKFENRFANFSKVILERIQGHQSAIYKYEITHPLHYTINSEIRFSQINSNRQDNSNSLEINTNSTKVIDLVQIPIIPTNPKLIDQTLLMKNVDSIYVADKKFFLSDNVNQTIKVYDRNFSLLKKYDFAGVATGDVPRLANGFDYSVKLRLLLGDRIIDQNQIFGFKQSPISLITPIYVLPKLYETNHIAIFDNGHHELRIYDISQTTPTLIDQVRATDFFQHMTDNPRKSYLLPLRFSQGIYLMDEKVKDFHQIESKQRSGQIIFPDVVNQDVKMYRYRLNNENLVKPEVGYFISRFTEQPDHPMAITTYRGLVLLADQHQNKIWVYDRKGEYIHTFNLDGISGIRYLFTIGNRLYVFTTKKVYSYSLTKL